MKIYTTPLQNKRNALASFETYQVMERWKNNYSDSCTQRKAGVAAAHISFCHVIKMRRVCLCSLSAAACGCVSECEHKAVLSKHKGRNNQCHMAILWLTTPPADSFCQNYCECVSPCKGEEFRINFSTLRSCVSIFYLCVHWWFLSFCAFDILQMAELLNKFLSGVPRNNWILRRMHTPLSLGATLLRRVSACVHIALECLLFRVVWNLRPYSFTCTRPRGAYFQPKSTLSHPCLAISVALKQYKFQFVPTLLQFHEKQAMGFVRVKKVYTGKKILLHGSKA